jgi:hypothetical protein
VAKVFDPIPVMPEFSDAKVPRLRVIGAEVDTAAAMMALVKYTREPHLIRSYKDVALRSYLSAVDLIAITALSPNEEQDVWTRVGPIGQWLEAEGLLKR